MEMVTPYENHRIAQSESDGIETSRKKSRKASKYVEKKISQEIDIQKKTWNNVNKLAMNRDEWKDLVEEVAGIYETAED